MKKHRGSGEEGLWDTDTVPGEHADLGSDAEGLSLPDPAITCFRLKKGFPKSKTNAVHLSAKRNSRLFMKLKSGKRYYVRVRAFTKSGGKKVYGKWSARKRVRVK